ncbi:hypothetical protein J1N35_020342 [Gossypium stocksii]|uniref:ATP synthase subunit epsilon, mitochondrial n=1 Tax=Gossypium stocksii TaxID=47602 RepID=A0A9D3VD27_9ROSI|nr:hypothetical protein J1N35_019683 [Gossypium stocksii]KAH1080581.1 hypothetical protein J1N35_020342 [Gossypium stocksii]
MASNAAVPFWRAAGMTYITYSNICANLVRNCLKEPYKTEALSREKVHFSISKWTDGKPEKPIPANYLYCCYCLYSFQDNRLRFHWTANLKCFFQIRLHVKWVFVLGL